MRQRTQPANPKRDKILPIIQTTFDKMVGSDPKNQISNNINMPRIKLTADITFILLTSLY